MTTLIDNLAAACRRDTIGEKWLIAPTYRVAHQWLDRVTLAEGRVANVRVKTVASLALTLAADRIAEQGLSPASAAQRRVAVASAWARAMDGAGGYLTSATPTPRLLEVAERAISDVRQAGLAPQDLADRHFEDARKGRELAALLEAYESALAERGLVDGAGVLRLAATVAASSGPTLLVPADLERSVLERRLLEAFPRDRVILLAVDEPGAGEATVLREGGLTIAHAVGEANEVREIFRACLADGRPLDQVEIVYTAAEPYATLIYETAQRVFDPDEALDLGVPVTFDQGVPARTTRPGRLLAAWLGWIRDGFMQHGLLRIIQAHLLESPVIDGRPVLDERMVSALRSLAIGFGRERYLPRIEREARSLERRAQRADDEEEPAATRDKIRRRGAGLRGLKVLVGELLAGTPEDAGDQRAVAEAARGLLARQARCPARVDRLARQHLLKELDELLEALGRPGTPVPRGLDVLQWLDDLPRSARVGGHGPLPGHLHVSSMRSGGHSGRGVTYVVGLDDGRFPPAGLQDPLILDAERGRLGADLPTSASRVARSIQDFHRLLARLRGRVTLSFSAKDLADGREVFASPVVLEIHRRMSGNADADHGDLDLALGPPASFAPTRVDACLDTGEWWMCQGSTEPPPRGMEALLAGAHPHLARGRHAAAERAGKRFTVFDGLVERPGDDLDLRTGSVAVSASRLQTLGECPLRYFYRYVLGIKPLEDRRVEPGQWLDPLDFGTLLHEVLHDFVGEMIAEKRWPPDAAGDRDRMERVCEAALGRWRADVPPPSDEPYERQRRRLHRACEIFLNERGGALREPHGRPLYLEASIGMEPQGPPTALDAPDPVEIALPGGGRIRAWARLDRIDAIEYADGGVLPPTRPGSDGRPRFAVIDYKSGRSARRYDPPDLYRQGRLLQHVMYMAVAARALRGHAGDDAVIDGFTFLFPDVSTHGRPVVFGYDIVAGGLEVIERLVTMAARGAFPASDAARAEDCTWCDFRAACRSVSRDLEDLCAASGRKRRNRDNKMLKEFVELRVDTRA